MKLAFQNDHIHGLTARHEIMETMMRASNSVFRSLANGQGYYSINLIRAIVVQAALVALIVEAAFLSERLVQTFEMVVGEPVSLTYVLPLLGWTAPEAYLALPTVVLVANYRVILQRREHREFIALAASGQSVRLFVGLAITIGVTVFLGSVLISGFVYPYSQFEFRSSRFDISYRSMVGGGSGRFYYFPDYAVYLWPEPEGQSNHPAFIQQGLESARYRISTANRSELLYNSEEGIVGLRLSDIVAQEIPIASPDFLGEATNGAEAAARRQRGAGTQHVRRFEHELDMTRLIRLDPRGAKISEWTTLELLEKSLSSGDSGMEATATKEVTSRFARGLVGLTAPLMAWIALSYTRRNSLPYVLPVFCALLMVFDIGMVTLGRSLAPLGVLDSWGILALVTGFVVATAAGIVSARHSDIARPALGRA